MKKKREISVLVVLFLITVASNIFAAPELRLPYKDGDEYVLTCGYGCGLHVSNNYYALDFDKPGIPEDQEPGEPVLVSMGGTVILSGLDGVYGYSVEIENNDGYVARVAHLRYPPIVIVGQNVFQGQQLGIMGGTGNNGNKDYNDHIHFQLYYNGNNAFPEPMSGYINFTEGESYVSDNFYVVNPIPAPPQNLRIDSFL